MKNFMVLAVLFAGVLALVGCGSSSPIVEPGPTLDTVTPAFGAAGGGTTLTIKGTNFTPEMAISLGNKDITAQDHALTFVDSETMTFETPPADGGTDAGIIISNPNGVAFRLAVFFYVPAPLVLSVTPDTGKPTGGILVTIVGRGFTSFNAGPVTVAFAGVPATDVVVENDVKLTCINPIGLGPANVEVTNANGVGLLKAGFRYFPPPSVGLVTPLGGTSLGGTSITVIGTGFDNNSPGPATVTIGASAAVNVVIVDDGTITCDTPPGAPGLVPVSVSNANGAGAKADAFTYFELPTVTAVSPGNGSYSGGTPMTVTGSGFAANLPGTNIVMVGGAPATSVTVVNDVTITCVTPTTTSVGPVDISVTNDNGTGTLAAAFVAEFHALLASGGGTLYSINTGTGAATSIGSIGSSPIALAVAPNYTLYGITGTTLLKINMLTGVGSIVAALSPATAMNELTFKGSRLIGVHRSSGKTYEINTATGAVTTLTGVFARTTYFAIGGPTGGIFKNGFEYDGTTFYYLPNESSDYAGRGDAGLVYSVNPDTGALSKGSLLRGCHAIQALAYYQGTMYGIEEDVSFAGGSPNPLLVVLNLSAATTTSTVGTLLTALNALAGTP